MTFTPISLDVYLKALVCVHGWESMPIGPMKTPAHLLTHRLCDAQAYTSAAFFEEVVKYIALRHLMEASHVMHPMALVAYGAWAGTAVAPSPDYLPCTFARQLCRILGPLVLTPFHCPTGSAFEVLESLLYYDFNSTLPAAVFRSVTPLHALTGMIMGATLAKHRFSSDRR